MIRKIYNYLFFKSQELKIPFDGKMNPWDMKYYQNLREQKEFSIDHSKIQEYFPMDVVINGTFKIYQVIIFIWL